MDINSVIHELECIKDYITPSAYYAIDDAIELLKVQGQVINTLCKYQIEYSSGGDTNGEENIL